ncbi:arsenic resistance protein [Hydrocarboniclastica marina]|uniref:Arsenic resistance protein n=1 Tax=Hydrocarboniclastica marina TaxID=2259620 RepID=A0A4V1D9B4_9ALTE|nr:arsenic resistance protein [Hydrocarboniclastica marina]QCF28100.1 arsenic resistance protein [Hydrocarboniclastica marina]
MRDKLERHQVWIYLLAILSGILTGWSWPEVSAVFELALWPMLGVLLYATFTQVPLVHLAGAFQDVRFLGVLVLGNFVLMPAVVWALLFLVPDNSALKLGVLLVLLVPCTDWFISFTHLGHGNGARAIAATPILLVLQIVMLPVYIWLFLGEQLVVTGIRDHLLPAFFGLILVPLLLAWVTEKAADTRPVLQRYLNGLGWLPVPVLAVVIYLIAASQVNLVIETGRMLWSVSIVFVLYLFAAAAVGKLLSEVFHIGGAPGRTLVFSFGTRNSFVVLPLAIALPEAWAAAVVVVVFQSLIELFGMVAYLKWVPRLIKDTPTSEATVP